MEFPAFAKNSQNNHKNQFWTHQLSFRDKFEQNKSLSQFELIFFKQFGTIIVVGDDLILIIVNIYLVAGGTVEATEEGARGGGRAQVGFAPLASVALRAAAGEETLAGVEAGAAVAAGPVVGAVVEVQVAEQTAPALVAQTLPRLAAGAVVAARVLQTLVAPSAAPSLLAPGRQNKSTISLVGGSRHKRALIARFSYTLYSYIYTQGLWIIFLKWMHKRFIQDQIIYYIEIT